MTEKFYRLQDRHGRGIFRMYDFALSPEEQELRIELGSKIPTPHFEKNSHDFGGNFYDLFYFTEHGYKVHYDIITALSCNPNVELRIEELPHTSRAITFRGASGLQVCINEKILPKKYSKKGGNYAGA